MLSREQMAKQLMVVLAILAALSSACSRKLSCTAKGETEADIVALALFAESYVSDTRHLPFLDAMTNVDLEVNSESFLRALSTSNELGRIYIVGRRTPFCDPWGHSYRFCLDYDGNRRIQVGGTSVRGLIAIWSDGPNGINEWGKGDDICSWNPIWDVGRYRELVVGALVLLVLAPFIWSRRRRPQIYL